MDYNKPILMFEEINFRLQAASIIQDVTNNTQLCIFVAINRNQGS